MKAPRIRSLVPPGRRHASDFKCSCPGFDEAEVLLELAALAQLPVVCERFAVDPSGQVVLDVAADGSAVLAFPRTKYLFPPDALLGYLNGLLEARRAGRRLYACTDAHEEAVVLVSTEEHAALVAAGVRVHGASPR